MPSGGTALDRDAGARYRSSLGGLRVAPVTVRRRDLLIIPRSAKKFVRRRAMPLPAQTATYGAVTSTTISDLTRNCSWIPNAHPNVEARPGSHPGRDRVGADGACDAGRSGSLSWAALATAQTYRCTGIARCFTGLGHVDPRTPPASLESRRPRPADDNVSCVHRGSTQPAPGRGPALVQACGYGARGSCGWFEAAGVGPASAAGRGRTRRRLHGEIGRPVPYADISDRPQHLALLGMWWRYLL
ncbi:hypothetical protein ThrDRAFT_03145 [Frankia casuarinae]|jgi:hypothetical protein|nr:hypothetical protein CcI6DRAFT_03775 [Frankia sp. CcI6]EYT91218.1 hypothetical protein ThrDRAFT_03145 [Frankia casuarinae]